MQKSVCLLEKRQAVLLCYRASQACSVSVRLMLSFRDFRNQPDSEIVKKRVIVYAGWLSHYCEDCAMPLHTTKDFDGRPGPGGTVEQKGIHGRIDAYPEKNGITVQMELLNSKLNHKDYMCDRTTWGVELCKRVGSPNFKLLYDIYHMQIDEGDVIQTIRDNKEYIGHYHTAGVPGRHEIDDSQELYYPAIMKAILETGFKGYVAQEFIPAGTDKIGALKNAVLICDI